MVPSIMASHPGPEAAMQPQTITLPPPCLTVGMMFVTSINVLVGVPVFFFSLSCLLSLCSLSIS